MRRVSLLLVLLWTQVGFGQDVPLTIEGGDVKIVKVDQVTIVKVDRTVVTSFPFSVKAPPDEGFYDWIYPAGVVAVDESDRLKVLTAPKGDLTVRVKIRSAYLENGVIKYKTRFGQFTFSVGDVGPPLPPTPPDPPKPPDPPNPPSPVAGLRVLVVYEATSGAPKLTKNQIDELWGEEVSVYTRSKFAKGPDGMTPEFRRFDKDIDKSKLSPVWRELFDQKRDSVPWLYVSNGTTGYSGPLPDGGILNLIKKYER